MSVKTKEKYSVHPNEEKLAIKEWEKLPVNSKVKYQLKDNKMIVSNATLQLLGLTKSDFTEDHWGQY